MESMLPDGEECEVTIYPRLEFIDQGENLSTIFCPACQAALHTHPDEAIQEWWYEVSDAAEAEGYEGYAVKMPCCRQTVQFTDLTFDWPAGFARFQLSMDNPQVSAPLSPEQIKELSTILGCEMRQVWAHY